MYGSLNFNNHSEIRTSRSNRKHFLCGHRSRTPFLLPCIFWSFKVKLVSDQASFGAVNLAWDELMCPDGPKSSR